MLEQGVDLIIQRFHWLAEFRLFIHYQRVWIIRNFFLICTLPKYVYIFPVSRGTCRRGVRAPAFSVFFLFFWKFCFLQPQHCVLWPQYVPTGYVHSETDGLMLLELLLKGSAALPVHCAQPWWTILGQPPRCEVEELWAILTLEPEYTDSKGCPRYYHPSGRQYRKGGHHW